MLISINCISKFADLREVSEKRLFLDDGRLRTLFKPRFEKRRYFVVLQQRQQDLSAGRAMERKGGADGRTDAKLLVRKILVDRDRMSTADDANINGLACSPAQRIRKGLCYGKHVGMRRCRAPNERRPEPDPGRTSRHDSSRLQRIDQTVYGRSRQRAICERLNPVDCPSKARNTATARDDMLARYIVSFCFYAVLSHIEDASNN